MLFAVYFDQQMGAVHKICCLIDFLHFPCFSLLALVLQVFASFWWKKGEEREKCYHQMLLNILWKSHKKCCLNYYTNSRYAPPLLRMKLNILINDFHSMLLQACKISEINRKSWKRPKKKYFCQLSGVCSTQKLVKYATNVCADWIKFTLLCFHCDWNFYWTSMTS